MENSKIGWTNHTLNPIRGCQVATLSDGVVSPACENCYAENMSSRFKAKNPEKVNVLGEWGIGTKRYFADDKYLNQALRWDRAAGEAGKRARVFVASLSDMFEGETVNSVELRNGVRNDYIPMIKKMWELMEKTPNLDWLWLTKRPWNMVRYLEENGTPKNFWAGATVENQKAANDRIPFLLQCKDAKVRFLSMEPLLEMVEFQREWIDRYYLYPDSSRCQNHRHEDIPGNVNGTINWVIVGAENLNKKPGRAMKEEWVKEYKIMCENFDVSYFVKQGEVDGIISDAYEIDHKTIKEIPQFRS